MAKAQNPGIFSSVVAADRRRPERMQDALLGAIWSVDRDQPVWKIRSMESLLDRDLAPQRFTARSDRRVRAAGAAARGGRRVRRDVVRGGAAHPGDRHPHGAGRGARHGRPDGAAARAPDRGWGTVLGLAGAYAGARLIARQLYGVPPTDLATFVAVPLALAAVATLACWVPARRAARVEPGVARSRRSDRTDGGDLAGLASAGGGRASGAPQFTPRMRGASTVAGEYVGVGPDAPLRTSRHQRSPRIGGGARRLREVDTSGPRSQSRLGPPAAPSSAARSSPPTAPRPRSPGTAYRARRRGIPARGQRHREPARRLGEAQRHQALGLIERVRHRSQLDQVHLRDAGGVRRVQLTASARTRPRSGAAR